MRHHIGLTIQLHPDSTHWREASAGGLRMLNAESDQPLVLPRLTFLLTLEREADSSYVRGQLRSLDSAANSYPIQSNLALFEAVERWLEQSDVSS